MPSRLLHRNELLCFGLGRRRFQELTGKIDPAAHERIRALQRLVLFTHDGVLRLATFVLVDLEMGLLVEHHDLGKAGRQTALQKLEPFARRAVA